MNTPPGHPNSNITERQSELQQRLAALDQLPLSFWLSDGVESDFRIVFWNKGAERIYGYTKAEALGHSYLTLFVTDEQRDQSRVDAQRVIDEGTHPANCIAIDKRKSEGSDTATDEIILLTNVFRYVIDGRAYQAEVAVDLTPSGFLEFLDQQYRDERDDPATHEEARQLNYFVRHAQRQVQNQLQLWGLTFSHSIRSELGNARDALQSLQSDMVDADLSNNNNFRALQAAVARLLNLSDNFHTYHRPPTAPSAPSDDVFNLNGILTNLADEYRYDAESMGLTIELSLDTTSLPVEGLPDAFEHAFRNVLGNAIDHANHNEVGVGVIRISVRLESGYVLLQISNPGHIDHEILKHSFSPFYAPLGTTAQRLHLGLYISNLWLLSMGGSLDIRNQNAEVIATIRWPISTSQLAKVRRRQ